jgi:hypothetical protein
MRTSHGTDNSCNFRASVVSGGVRDDDTTSWMTAKVREPCCRRSPVALRPGSGSEYDCLCRNLCSERAPPEQIGRSGLLVVLATSDHSGANGKAAQLELGGETDLYRTLWLPKIKAQRKAIWKF